MTRLLLLIADLRYAELCVLGCKFVGDSPKFVLTRSIWRASSSSSDILRSRIPPTVALTRMTR